MAYFLHIWPYQNSIFEMGWYMKFRVSAFGASCFLIVGSACSNPLSYEDNTKNKLTTSAEANAIISEEEAPMIEPQGPILAESAPLPKDDENMGPSPTGIVTEPAPFQNTTNDNQQLRQNQ